MPEKYQSMKKNNLNMESTISLLQPYVPRDKGHKIFKGGDKPNWPL